MPNLLRTSSANPYFRQLVHDLDRYLAIRNGAANDFFVQFNQIDSLKQVVVAYLNNIPVGCGAIKPYDEQSMELKRMFVPSSQRGKGVASAVLRELESWAKELGATRCILETGRDMQDAVNLYQKCGYTIIPNYGQYTDVEDSICFEKIFIW